MYETFGKESQSMAKFINCKVEQILHLADERKFSEVMLPNKGNINNQTALHLDAHSLIAVTVYVATDCMIVHHATSYVLIIMPCAIRMPRMWKVAGWIPAEATSI